MPDDWHIFFVLTIGQKFEKVENDENRFFCNNFFKIGQKLIL